jgi:hypothetical protein
MILAPPIGCRQMFIRSATLTGYPRVSGMVASIGFTAFSAKQEEPLCCLGMLIRFWSCSCWAAFTQRCFAEFSPSLTPASVLVVLLYRNLKFIVLSGK